jgi:hypothetical protein
MSIMNRIWKISIRRQALFLRVQVFKDCEKLLTRTGDQEFVSVNVKCDYSPLETP